MSPIRSERGSCCPLHSGIPAELFFRVYIWTNIPCPLPSLFLWNSCATSSPLPLPYLVWPGSLQLDLEDCRSLPLAYRVCCLFRLREDSPAPLTLSPPLFRTEHAEFRGWIGFAGFRGSVSLVSSPGACGPACASLTTGKGPAACRSGRSGKTSAARVGMRPPWF